MPIQSEQCLDVRDNKRLRYDPSLKGRNAVLASTTSIGSHFSPVHRGRCISDRLQNNENILNSLSGFPSWTRWHDFQVGMGSCPLNGAHGPWIGYPSDVSNSLVTHLGQGIGGCPTGFQHIGKNVNSGTVDFDAGGLAASYGPKLSSDGVAREIFSLEVNSPSYIDDLARPTWSKDKSSPKQWDQRDGS